MNIKLRLGDYFSNVLGPTIRAASFWITGSVTIIGGSILAYFISQTWFKTHYLLIPIGVFILAFIWSNVLAYSALLDRIDTAEAKLSGLILEVESAAAGEHLRPVGDSSQPAFHHIVVFVAMVARNRDGQNECSIELTGCHTSIDTQQPDQLQLFFETITHQTWLEADPIRRHISSGATRSLQIRLVCRLPISERMTDETRVKGNVELRDNKDRRYSVAFEAEIFKNPIQ